MNGAFEFASVVVVGLVLLIVALLLMQHAQNRQAGDSYPKDVQQILGALAAVAVFFAVKSENKLDDAAVNQVLLPVFKLLGVEVPTLPPAQSGQVTAAASVAVQGKPEDVAQVAEAASK